MTDRHAEQPLLSQILMGACARMIAEACAGTKRHKEVRARMTMETRERMLAEARSHKFLLIVRACTEARAHIFLLNIQVCKYSRIRTNKR